MKKPLTRNQKFIAPPKEEVTQRMLTGLAEPEKIDLKIPEELEYMRADLYEYETIKRPKAGEKWPRPKLNEKYTMPHLWNFRPKRSAIDNEESIDGILEKIAELPNDTQGKFWTSRRKNKWTGKKKLPQYIGEMKPFNACYVDSIGGDNVVQGGTIIGVSSTEPFTYKGRKITPSTSSSGEKCFKISGNHECFEWTFFQRDRPIRSWQLNGTIWREVKIVIDTGEIVDRWGGHSRYPESGVWDNSNDPNWKRPLSLDLDIAPSVVYGNAYLGLKTLTFHCALDVAINFIELVDYAYSLDERPKELDLLKVKKPPVEKQVQNPPRKEVVYQALKLIVEDSDKALFTKTGKPRCSALSARVNGKRVSAKERNEAMKRYRASLPKE